MPAQHQQLASLASWWCDAFASINNPGDGQTVWNRTVALVEQTSIREGLAGLYPPGHVPPPPSMADLRDVDAGHLVGTKAEQLELNLTIHAAYAARTASGKGVGSGWGGTGGQAKSGRMWTAAAAFLKEMDARPKGKTRASETLPSTEREQRSADVRQSVLAYPFEILTNSSLPIVLTAVSGRSSQSC